jgi:hypothetical protein
VIVIGELGECAPQMFRDQPAMPSHDRVWRDDRSDPVEKSSAEWLALSCEASPLVVVQSRPLLALEFSEDAVLFEHVGDQPRLITVDVACECD